MHITILSTSWPLQPGSSSGIFVKWLVDALPDRIRRTVITPCPDYTVETGPQSPVAVHCFRYAPQRWQRLTHQPGGLPVALRSNRLLTLLLPFMLLAMLFTCIRNARRADLLHANWSLNGLVAGIAGRLTATPVVTTLRGSDITGIEQSLMRRLLLRGCLLTSCRIVAVNQTIRETVGRLYPRHRERVVTIPNGVDQRFLDLPEASRLADEPIRLVSIGNLNPNKGMHVLLAAVSQLSATWSVQLRIVGDGPERMVLQQQADAIGNPRITIELTGAVAPDTIPAILADADIFILASRAEGRPNVILEAMAAARPVLASDIDGIRELVSDNDTGLLFPVEDAAALADRLQLLLHDPALRQRLGRAARDHIIDNRLTWEQCAQRYTELYDSCLEKHGR